MFSGIFKNKYNEIRSGWFLVLSYVLLIGAQIVELIVLDLFDSEPISVITLSLVAVCLFLLAFRLVYKRPVRQIGLYRQGCVPHLLLGMLFGAVAVAVAVVILLVAGAAQIRDADIGGVANGSFWLGALMYVGVGFWEEIFSRGLMMTVLKTTRNRLVIVLLPAVIFGFLHMFNDGFTALSLVNLTLVSILFAYMFIKTGRLWMPIGFHITWNFTMGYVFGIPVSGNAVTFSLMRTEFAGTEWEWLTGSDLYGLEVGAVCTIVVLIGIVLTHFLMKSDKRFWTFDSDLPYHRHH